MDSPNLSRMPRPEDWGFNDPAETVAYYKGHAAGQAVVNIMMGEQMAMEHHAATHDYLTGLPNRAGLEEFIRNIPPEDLENYGVLFADGYRFKQINDTSGHARGDEALVYTARGLENSLRIARGKDFVARVGGDEFIMLIYTGSQDNDRRQGDQSPEQQMKVVRERVADEMEAIRREHTDLAKYPYDLSVGTAFFKPGATIESLKAEAEREMYDLKAASHEQFGKYVRP